jgi:flagellar basal-body rod protein FlgB
MADRSLDFLTRMLSACEHRARVVSANIANSNTPGYTRRVVRFEELLRDRLVDGQDTSEILPVTELDMETPARPDGNNVSLEAELNSMRENRLLYETYSSILRSHFNLLTSALDVS